jgi:hypothetical protein
MAKFENTHQIEYNGKVITILPNQLEAFSNRFINDSDILNKCSERFLLDLYVLSNEGGFNPGMIVEELIALESQDKQSQMKSEIQFSRLPLKGLWHTHFFSSRFIAKNMLIANSRGKIDSVIKSVLKKYDGVDRTVENCSKIAREICLGNQGLFDKRSDNNQLTGEWIVYAKVHSKNYYMCIDCHSTADQIIYNKVIKACKADFESILSEVESYA